jgi:hypothetical protein
MVADVHPLTQPMKKMRIVPRVSLLLVRRTLAHTTAHAMMHPMLYAVYVFRRPGRRNGWRFEASMGPSSIVRVRACRAG